MRPPRGLSPQEAELWARVAATVKPLRPRAIAVVAAEPASAAPPLPPGKRPPRIAPVPATQPALRVAPVARPVRPLDRDGLDGSWEKKLARAEVHPDFTLDLHGHGLDAAHARLDHGLIQALALGARVVLLITGRPRPAEAADRGERRGAIRAKVLDWLAAGPHASRIAAVRPAHRKHGGAGALYIILRRVK
ncbi:Smr/MutS family protein [Novosphingobium sp.]|uniref:Smr/MutS family protein n=1 Tax=Novosphingobium sp. TaxID=1874826 RepID=UPI002734F5E5|nr:Smr/MutS family protein [Novosphingobium sp.]MDP3905872.1 Smr/MutS family protein [Novosphingobium sp.]